MVLERRALDMKPEPLIGWLFIVSLSQLSFLENLMMLTFSF